jgi:hypothetical protein
MPPPELKEFFRQTVLYLVNVYEPCGEREIRDVLSGPAAAVALRYPVSVEELRSALAWLVSSGLAVRTSKKQFVVTNAGLKLLAAQRLAFPRDKHRIYFLRKMLKRRGR